jgi:hypothetical protein
MGAILMSLLFISNILDGFQALDDGGRPLPNAVLTFWDSGTVHPRAVYADQELSTVLSDPAGRVVGDAAGRFPFIYLQTTGRYRVRLETAVGVLRWDVDPYICDCKDPPYLFRAPVFQALTPTDAAPPSYAAPSIAGAVLRFTDADDPNDAPVKVFADAARTVSLANPLKSNAGGIFPPVYLDDDLTYRVRIEDARGDLLLDVDPYECECGFELLTSRPYPLEDSSASGPLAVEIPRDFPTYVVKDETQPSVGILSGTLNLNLRTYDNYPPDASGDNVFSLLSGTLTVNLRTYNNYPPDASEAGATIIGGTLT